MSSVCPSVTFRYRDHIDNSLESQSADKDQQEMRAVAEKPHDSVVKFDTYHNVQRHRAVLPVIAWLMAALV